MTAGASSNTAFAGSIPGRHVPLDWKLIGERLNALEPRAATVWGAFNLTGKNRIVKGTKTIQRFLKRCCRTYFSVNPAIFFVRNLLQYETFSPIAFSFSRRGLGEDRVRPNRRVLRPARCPARRRLLFPQGRNDALRSCAACSVCACTTARLPDGKI